MIKFDFTTFILISELIDNEAYQVFYIAIKHVQIFSLIPEAFV